MTPVTSSKNTIEISHPQWDEPIICRVEVDLPQWLSQLAGGREWEYHNGYAIVDVEGQSLFDGSLTAGTSDCAHLTYYHADSGEKIMLN
jgi:hypothetical protein